MNILSIISLNIKTLLTVAVAPLFSGINSMIGGKHHSVSELIDKKMQEGNNLPKNTRNIYLTDLGGTFIDWGKTNRSVLQSIKQYATSHSYLQKTKYFDGAKDFLKKLNAEGVHTAIISNRGHNQVIGRARHNSWGGLFDRMYGHDRLHANTMTKRPWLRLPAFMKYSRTALARYAISELLNEKVEVGMKPVNVVFVGDRTGLDIQTANLLDTALKRLNPESSCLPILLNSRQYSKQELAQLSGDKKPRVVANDYKELEIAVDKYFASKKELNDAETKTSESARPDMAEKEKPSEKIVDSKTEGGGKKWKNYLTEQADTKARANIAAVR